jgi:hypothetical protein
MFEHFRLEVDASALFSPCSPAKKARCRPDREAAPARRIVRNLMFAHGADGRIPLTFDHTSGLTAHIDSETLAAQGW